MTTIINTPPTSQTVESADSGMGIILGVLFGILLVVLFLIYGLPAIRANNPQPKPDSINVNVQLPTTDKTNPAPTTNP